MSRTGLMVRRFLKSLNWKCLETGPTHCRVVVPGEGTHWVWLARWDEEDSFFAGYSFSPASVPPGRLTAAAEYLTRANYNLRLGNFEMDYSDGQVCFKTSMIFENVRPTVKLIERMSIANFTIMEQYLPGLLEVIYGKARPKDVIERIERADRQDVPVEPDQADEPDEAGEAGESDEAPTRHRVKLKPRKKPIDPAAERTRRVAQLAEYIKLFQARRQEQKSGSCFLIFDVKRPADRPAGKDGARTATVQFCFKDKWFAIDIPNVSRRPAEAEQILNRRGFYREAERPDVGLTSEKNLAKYDPIGKKYIYGDQQEAAEDAAYIMFDVWNLPLDTRLRVSSFSTEGTSWPKELIR